MSDSSASSTAPLLESEIAESSNAAVQEPLRARVETPATPGRGPPPSFLDGYESVGGIPTRVIKPSIESAKFTCHAFSPDDTLLATGESNGTIKIWRTTNYTCATEALRVFASSVESLAFLSGSNDRVIAVDALGNIVRCTIKDGQLQKSGSANLDIPSRDSTTEKMAKRLYRVFKNHDRETEILQQRITRLSEDGNTAAVAVVSWTARDRRCFITIQHKIYILIAHSWKIVLSEEHESVLEGIPFPEQFDMGNHLNFSRTGNSLLAFKSLLPKNIVMYQSVIENTLWKRVAEGHTTCAEWGRTEEHVLRWWLTDDDPYISICETKNLADSWNGSEEINRLSLSRELLEVNAQVVEGPFSDGAMKVFIFETDTCRRTRVFVWDTKANSAATEIKMPLLPTTCGAGNGQQQPLNQDISFCVSRDGKWIGYLHRSCGTCALAWVDSGTVAWTYDCLDRTKTAGALRFGQVTFSPSQRHFLVLTEDCIVAFAPAALNRDTPSRMRTIPLTQFLTSDAQCRNANSRRRVHPDLANSRERVLLEGLSRLLRKLPRGVLKSKFGLIIDDLPDNERIRDASFSTDGKHLAIISEQSTRTIKIEIGSVHRRNFLYVHHFADARFPSVGHETFIPARLHFHPTETQDGLVVFPDECSPWVAFYQLAQQFWQIKRLEIKRRLYYCQTEDKRRICVLDVNGVSILDLSSREIVERISYRVDFTYLPVREERMDLQERTPEEYQPFSLRARENLDSFYGELMDRNPHLIADDGESIVIPWVAEKRQYSVITPSMEPEDWDALLKCGTGGGFCYCAVSGDGECIASIRRDGRKSSVAIDSAIGNTLYDVKSDWHFLDREDVICSVTSSVFTAMIIDTVAEEDTPSSKILRVHQFGIYSAEEFMPDYQCLRTEQPENVSSSVAQLVRDHGVSVLNGLISPGMTIAQEAVLKDDKETLDVIKESIQTHKMELALDWVNEEGEEQNLLEEAIKSNSTNSIDHVIDLMKNKLVPFDKAALSLKKCWKDLCNPRLRETLRKVLAENAFVFKACHVPVHVHFLNSTLRKWRAVDVGTADSFVDWKVPLHPECLQRKWQSHNSEVIEEMEKDGNQSKTEAVLSFVCIADAAKPGMDGIIRPLLLHKAPARFFQSDVVKWVIQHKWHKTWSRRVKWSLARHAAFLVCFTAYIFIVGGCGDLSGAHLWKQILSSFLIVGIAAYGVMQFSEEINQIKNSVADGKECLGGWWPGVCYYFRSRWNVLDLVSSSLLLAVIPTYHCIELFRSGYQKLLSVFVSVGIILAYLKVWYHAQAFQSTGALVMMIDHIFKDSVYFLGLAFVVLCGFALALNFLLRHAASDYPRLSLTKNESNSTNWGRETELEEKAEKAWNAFGNVLKSLETLFFALLADFDRDVYRADDDLGWLIVAAFVIYLITLVILLLNLLISTMGDTFDFVRSNEDNLLLKNRAKFIDGCEAALSDYERQKIANEVRTYVHGVSDPKDSCNEETERWTGRLNAIQQAFRRNIRKIEQKTKTLILKNKDTTTAVTRVEDKLVELEDSIREDTTTAVTKVEDKLVELEDSIRETVQAEAQELEARVELNVQMALREQEGRVAQTVRAAVQEQESRIRDLMENRLAENSERMERMMRENEATQIRLDQLLSLLQQRQD